MQGEYTGELSEDFGADGLGDALADLNDAFDELEGFDAVGGAFTVAAPVLIGGGLTFGAAAALDYFITEPETRESVLPYKWLIGAGVGTLAGLIVWRTKLGPTAGIVTIASSLMLSLAGWGLAKLAETGKEETTKQQQPQAGYQAYYRMPAPEPVGSLGRYERVEAGELPPGDVVGEGTISHPTILSGARVNPGVFG